MRQSLLSAIFAASLLLECHVLSGALPVTMPDDGSVERDALASDNGLGEPDLEAGPSGPRLIVVGDPGLWGELRALHAGLGLNRRRAERGGPMSNLKDGGQDGNIPILRRDSMRCMVGRVYRPCWEV